MNAKLKWIAGVWRPLRAWFVVLFVFTALATVAAIAWPLVFRELIDSLHGMTEGAGDAAVWMAVWLLVAVGLARFVAGFYPAVRAQINAKIEKQVRETYFAYVLRKGYRFFLRFRTGDIVTRLTDDITDYPRIAWFCCSGIFRAVESGTKFAFCMAVMLWMDWRLALMAVAPLPVMLAIFAVAQRKLARAAERQREEVSETNDRLEASFSGIAIVKAFNAGPRQAAALKAHLDRRTVAEVSLVRMWQIIHTFHTSVNSVGQIVVIGVGGLFVLQGQISVGTFYAFFVYLTMLVHPLLDLPNLLVTGRQAFVCIDRVEQLRSVDQEGEGGALRGTRPVGPFERLELCGVGFAFPEGARPGETITDAAMTELGRPVLSDVNVDLHAGDRLAIVGRLGEGKSTLLKLAAGTLVPTVGEVRLNGQPMDRFGRESFGQAVAVVPQDPVLFSETVRENIVLGRPLDDVRLAAVVDAVGMRDEIAGFSDGLDTRVGQRGVTLSGGQRQRLAIARALYGLPQLLLLDDLTSALDAANEDRLWRRIAELIPHAAVLVVTHRVATARAMDRIAVLENGSISAIGRHDDLLDRSALYAEFQHDAPVLSSAG